MLTKRELEILSALSCALSNKGIGEVLNLSPKTVENNLNNIYSKIGIIDSPRYHKRVAAVCYYKNNYEKCLNCEDE